MNNLILFYFKVYFLVAGGYCYGERGWHLFFMCCSVCEAPFPAEKPKQQVKIFNQMPSNYFNKEIMYNEYKSFVILVLKVKELFSSSEVSWRTKWSCPGVMHSFPPDLILKHCPEWRWWCKEGTAHGNFSIPVSSPIKFPTTTTEVP